MRMWWQALSRRQLRVTEAAPAEASSRAERTSVSIRPHLTDHIFSEIHCYGHWMEKLNGKRINEIQVYLFENSGFLEVRLLWTQNENAEGGQWKMTWFERNFGPVWVQGASPVRAAHLAHNSFGRWSLQTWRAMNNAEYNKSSNWLFLATCILGYYFFLKCFRFSYYRHSPLFSKSL